MSLLCFVLGERDFSRRPELVVHRDTPTKGRSARDFRYAFTFVLRGPFDHYVGHVRNRLDALLNSLLNSLMDEVGQSHQQVQIHAKRLP